jgi:hypothetical protein
MEVHPLALTLWLLFQHVGSICGICAFIGLCVHVVQQQRNFLNNLVAMQKLADEVKMLQLQRGPMQQLPPRWEAVKDPQTGCIYYQNHVTMETQWKPPPQTELVAVAPGATPDSGVAA